MINILKSTWSLFQDIQLASVHVDSFWLFLKSLNRLFCISHLLYSFQFWFIQLKNKSSEKFGQGKQKTKKHQNFDLINFIKVKKIILFLSFGQFEYSKHLIELKPRKHFLLNLHNSTNLIYIKNCLNTYFLNFNKVIFS